MDFSDIVIFDYDNENKIAELSAKEKVVIDTSEKLDLMCGYVKQLLSDISDNKPCFMIVDISHIAIEPHLVDAYSKHIQQLSKEYLYPDGLVRYGFEITRVTVKLINKKLGKELGKIFNRREDALAYCKNLRARKFQRT